MKKRSVNENKAAKKEKKIMKNVSAFVKKDDHFSEEQLAYVRKKVGVFSAMISIMTLAAVFFVVFVTLTVGLKLFLADNSIVISVISVLLWAVIITLAVLSGITYVHLGRTVARYRNPAKYSKKSDESETLSVQESVCEDVKNGKENSEENAAGEKEANPEIDVKENDGSESNFVNEEIPDEVMGKKSSNKKQR